MLLRMRVQREEMSLSLGSPQTARRPTHTLRSKEVSASRRATRRARKLSALILTARPHAAPGDIAAGSEGLSPGLSESQRRGTSGRPGPPRVPPGRSRGAADTARSSRREPRSSTRPLARSHPHHSPQSSSGRGENPGMKGDSMAPAASRRPELGDQRGDAGGRNAP